MKRGSLIAFEGLDGSGKTTQLRRLAAALRAAGHAVVETGEPSAGPVGRRIREMARSAEPISGEDELRLFVEDRREHVAEVIVPALAAGQVVLTDRYTLSSVAYQGARGLDPQEILRAGEAEFPAPDLAIVLEIDPGRGLERVSARGLAGWPTFEHQARQERAAEIFAALECPYVSRIDGSASEEDVERCVAEVVRLRLGLV